MILEDILEKFFLFYLKQPKKYSNRI